MEKEFLHRFFENRATRVEEELILAWLDENPVNNKELLAERKIFDAMLLLGSDKPAAVKRPLLALPRWTKEVMKYAAVLLVAAGVGGFYVSNWQHKLLSSTNTITVPAGQRVDIVLPDGTKVCMNALSTLEYPSYFVGDNRKVKLAGEAFFEVTHDVSQPFIVETYACDVEVLGTHFNVEARVEHNRFSTSLVDGGVRVSDRKNPAQKAVLISGQRATYLEGRLVVDRIPEHERFQWRDGVIAFRDASFAELIAKFEQYYGVRIELRNKPISTAFTGKIRISEGLDHALWVLQQSAPFSYARNATKDIIYIQ